MMGAPKQSAATIAKRAESLKRYWANVSEQDRAARVANAADGFRARLARDPTLAKSMSEAASERMRRRHHEDPEFQVRRSERSSRVMRENWTAHRESYVQAVKARYAAGTGIATPEGRRKAKAAAKWILKQAWAEMLADTTYAETYRSIQARLRLEKPYDGPQTDADYQDYLRDLGRRVVQSEELKAIQNGFMSQAIPRWSDTWRAHHAHSDGTESGT